MSSNESKYFSLKLAQQINQVDVIALPGFEFSLTALYFQEILPFLQSEESFNQYLYKMWNLCMSVVKNTWAREQQEWKNVPK